MLKIYIRFFYAGSFVSDHSDSEVKSKNIPVDIGKAYAFQFYERIAIYEDGEELLGKPKNFSQRYIKGEVFDAARVAREVPDNRILLENMRYNKWEKVIKCAQGFLPLYADDFVI